MVLRASKAGLPECMNYRGEVLLHEICVNLETVVSRAGVIVKGFNSKLAMVKMYSTGPLLNKCILSKKIKMGLQTPLLPQTLTMAYGKGQNLNI